MKGKPDYYGWGSKQGSKVRTWKTRYFVLRGRELAYFSGAARDASGGGAGEKGRLRVVDVDYAPDRKHGLLVHGEKKELKMTTTSAEESRELFRKIKQAVGKLPPSPRAASKPQAAMAGWLLKEEPRLRTWKRRYVTLHRNELTYYADADAQPLTTDIVRQAAADGKSPLSLTLRTSGGVVHVAAETREEIEKWDHALAKALGQPEALRQVADPPMVSRDDPAEPAAARKQSVRRCEGWLEKLGQHGSTWKKRYFLLTDSMLEYRKGPMESLSAELFVTDVRYSYEHADALEIEFGADHSSRQSGSLCVRAESIRELDKWMSALCDAVGKPRLQLETVNSPSSSASSPSSDASSHEQGSKAQLAPFRRNPSLPQDEGRSSASSSSSAKSPRPTSPASVQSSSDAYSVAAPATNGRVKRGWLYKQGYYSSSWKLRYFVLDGRTLNHYKHASGSSKGHGVITSVSRSSEPAGSLEIRLDGANVIKVYGETKTDTDAWYAALRSWSLDAADGSEALELVDNQDEEGFGQDNGFHGWLLKKGQNWKSWKRRYFVLERSRLAYSADVDGELLGSGVVFEVSVGEQRPLCIDIRFQNGRLLHVVAPTEAAFGKWFAALQQASNLAESFLSQSRGKIVFDDEFDNDAGENEAEADVDFTEEDILEYSRTIGSDEGAALWIAAMENKPEYDHLSSSDTEHGDDERESVERLSADVLPRVSDTSSTVSQSKGCLGWLKKEGGNIKSWKRRYFTLYGTKLSYYKSETGSLLRSVRVAGVSEQPSAHLGLEISTLAGRTLVVQAESHEDFDKWLHAIQGALAEEKERKSSVVKAPIAEASVGSSAVVENGHAVVTHSGWLEKEGQRFKTWKRRYFSFKNGALIYYGDVGGAARGHGRVTAAEPDYSKPHTLKLTFRSGKTMRVTAANDQEVDAWLQVLSRDRSSVARTTATLDLSDDLLDSEGEDEEPGHGAPVAKRLDSTDYFSNDTITNDSLLRLREQQGKDTFLQSFEGGNHSFKGELTFQDVEEEKDDFGASTNGVEYYRELLAEDERVQGERESERLARKGEAPIAGCAPCCIVM